MKKNTTRGAMRRRFRQSTQDTCRRRREAAQSRKQVNFPRSYIGLYAPPTKKKQAASMSHTSWLGPFNLW